MKKIFLTLILFFIFGSSVLGEEESIPSWSEFCPPQYLDGRNLSVEEYVTKFNIKLIKPTQKKVDEYNKNVNYWLTRKEQFEHFVNTCSGFPDDKKEACYSRIEDRELRLNAQLEKEAQEAKKEAQMNAASRNVQRNSATINPHARQMTNMLKMINPEY